MQLFSKEKMIIRVIVKLSVKRCLFNVYVRNVPCQHFVTVSRFFVTGKPSGQRSSSFRGFPASQ